LVITFYLRLPEQIGSSGRLAAMNPILGISMASSLLSALSRTAATQPGAQVAATTGAEGSALSAIKDAPRQVLSAAATALQTPGRALNILV
jgi:hypothetical protein